MKVPVYNIEGKKTSSKELSADVFGIEPNDHAIYLDVKRYLAAQRQGTHKAKERADREGVDVRHYTVIYNALEDIENSLKGMLKPEYEEKQMGTAEVREIFKSSKFGTIAGSYVRSGLIKRNALARVLRDGEMIQEGLKVDSLKRFKDDVTEVKTDYECGIGLGDFNDVQIDDVIETYEMVEKPRV